MATLLRHAGDDIKWHPRVKVIKYNPDTVQDIIRTIGHEPSGAELRELEATAGLTPDDFAYAEGNLLTTAGLARITSLITGNGGNTFGVSLANTNATVGVGDHQGNSTQSQAVGDADLYALTGATHRYIQQADASNPTTSNGVITCNSTFTTGNANFAWNEWAWGIATGAITPGTGSFASVAATSMVMLNHAVPASSLGTKASGASWTLQATITLS